MLHETLLKLPVIFISRIRNPGCSKRRRFTRAGPSGGVPEGIRTLRTRASRVGRCPSADVHVKEVEMFLVTKAAWAGIVFLSLTPGISRPHQSPPPSGVNPSDEVPTVMRQTDVRKVQEALQGNGQYGRKVDGVFGLRTRASIRGFQKAENLPVTGQLDAETAGKLGVSPEGREETRSEVTQAKPSAGIKWDADSRRASKRKAAKKTTRAVPPPA